MSLEINSFRNDDPNNHYFECKQLWNVITPSTDAFRKIFSRLTST